MSLAKWAVPPVAGSSPGHGQSWLPSHCSTWTWIDRQYEMTHYIWSKHRITINLQKIFKSMHTVAMYYELWGRHISTCTLNITKPFRLWNQGSSKQGHNAPTHTLNYTSWQVDNTYQQTDNTSTQKDNVQHMENTYPNTCWQHIPTHTDNTST